MLWPASLILIALLRLAGTAAAAAASAASSGGRSSRRRPPAALIAVGRARLRLVHTTSIRWRSCLAAGTIVLVLARTALTFGENTRLLERSRTESLTDCADRHRQPPQARRSTSTRISAARASDEPHLLVVFDLNGFKGYNDSFGHPAGDALLARLAGKLKDCRRAGRRRVPHGRRRVLRADPRLGDAAAPRSLRRSTRRARASSSRARSEPSRCRTRRPTRARRSASPTSGSTRTRTGCLPRARARTSCCCGRSPSANPACAPTSRVWPGSPSPSAANSA